MRKTRHRGATRLRAHRRSRCTGCALDRFLRRGPARHRRHPANPGASAKGNGSSTSTTNATAICPRSKQPTPTNPPDSAALPNRPVVCHLTVKGSGQDRRIRRGEVAGRRSSSPRCPDGLVVPTGPENGSIADGSAQLATDALGGQGPSTGGPASRMHPRTVPGPSRPSTTVRPPARLDGPPCRHEHRSSGRRPSQDCTRPDPNDLCTVWR